MKSLINIICFAWIVNVSAQSNTPVTMSTAHDTTAKGMTTSEMIKKHRQIKRGCIQIDTVISAMKKVNDTQQEIITKLKEIKQQYLTLEPK